MRHVDFEFLNEFIRGELSAQQALRCLIGHLAERCPECRSALALLVDELSSTAEMLVSETAGGQAPACDLEGLRAALPDPRYVGALDKLEIEARDWARRVRAEKKRARADLRSLRRLPAAERAERIRTARTRFRSRAFAELLLEDARRLTRTEPDEAAALADLVPLAVLWIPGAQGLDWARTIELRAAACRANALRVGGHIRDADRAFALLRADVARSPVEDPAVLAEVASLEASLRMNRQEWSEARELLRQAELFYRLEGDFDGIAKVALKRGIVERWSGELADAVRIYRRALDHLDPAESPHLFLCALSNLSLALCDDGRFHEAEALLAEHEAIYRRHGDAWSRPLELWMIAQIAAGLGRTEKAEGQFLEVRKHYVEVADGFHAALVSFDLAALYLEQGRTEELRRVAQVMRDLFSAEGLADHALTALALFQQAVAAETVTVAAIRGWRRQLERSGRSPEEERVA